MNDTVLLYTSDKENSSEPVNELAISDAAAKELLVISAAAFQVTYCAPANKGVFDPDTSQRLKEANRVYAALLSPGAKFNAVDRDSRQGRGMICAETQISWNAIKQIHGFSEAYANLLRQLDATEEKCMSTDRNDIRRREIQESYEYLDREIERLNHLLKQIRLIDA